MTKELRGDERMGKGLERILLAAAFGGGLASGLIGSQGGQPLPEQQQLHDAAKQFAMHFGYGLGGGAVLGLALYYIASLVRRR